MEIKEKIIEIIANVIQITPSELTLNSSIGDFPTWDSMGQMNILVSVQDYFKVTFEPVEMINMETVSDIIQNVTSKIGK